ncbi:RiPP maturation radical SAM C-methyltransferase [Mesorhizobium sp. CA14]|uniref:RiPP maturation radical SAM C-methyltransferase n=1 Tax=Mesorhizobium sp. CA14 TaxID=2876642 RepID=UPI001CCB8CEE|nr:RiPP maturation radical SAM C-methyltransferase [Mesorhizobium sp. CA14]MBZ9850021.1 RiPP maturation radical SAM C-methyltransferase [Mesorhizobium sp. CA14]
MKRAATVSSADFVMVVMPWALTNQPSVQAGLICALLNQAGISARTLYANLSFASALEWSRYEEFCGFHNHAADWLFSEAVFGPFTPSVPHGPADFAGFAALYGNDAAGFQKLCDMKSIVETCLHECLSAVAWKDVQVVGFTTTMLQPLPALALAKLLKTAHPHLKILMGGAGCQGAMGSAMHRNFWFVDGVVDGDADNIVAPVVRALLEGNSPLSIPGLHWRDQVGSVSFTAPSAVVDLSSYPVPDYTDYFEQSKAVGNPNLHDVRLPFEASRGCWWGERHHCAFCGLNGTTMLQRDRPTEAVIHEVRTLAQRHEPALFICTDNIISQRHLRELPSALVDVNTPVFFEVGAAMSRRRMQALAEAGIRSVQVGIESLSTAALKLMNKGTSASLNICFLRRALEFRINAYWNLLYGLPGEDKDWYRDMIGLFPSIHHLAVPEPTRFSLQRFSPYFDHPDRYGITVTGPMPAARYVWNLPDVELTDIGYELDFTFQGQEYVDEIGARLDDATHEWRNKSVQLRVLPKPDGSAIVFDTRLNRGTIDRLTAEEAAVLSCAEKPIGHDEILRRIRTHLPALHVRMGGQSGVERVLTVLVEHKLLLSIDQRYLALPVPQGPFWAE